MYIKCWQCNEELDTSSVEKQIYQSLIEELKFKMCDGSVDGDCDVWWRHDDCRILSVIIEELREKL